jgi:erythromycin esterase
MKPNRSTLVALALLGAAPSHADPLDDWLATHARVVRTLDANDEDFTDLQPLGAAIGKARVVMLGEPSHGAGSAFAAKARLVRFLHRKMGFDVVAWESNVYDVHTLAERGTLPVWSRAMEVQPLFEYARARNRSPRPLEMAGFDINASAPQHDERFGAWLATFVEPVDDSALKRAWTTLAADTMTALARIKARDAKPVADDLANLESRIGELRELMRVNLDALTRARSRRTIDLLDRELANLLASSTNTYFRRCCDKPVGDAALRLQSEEWNRRDTLMAANLLRSLDEEFRGRKVVVWGHNAHLLRQYFAADWKGVHAEPQPDGMTPMGALVAKKLGDAVYSIAFTTYDGEEAWTNGQRRGPIAAAPAGSVEARLHALGKPHLFVDLRAARNARARPLSTPTTLRISGFGEPTARYGNDAVTDLAQAFDGVFFIDRMAPATQVGD